MKLNDFNGIKIPVSEQEIRKKYPFLLDQHCKNWYPEWVFNQSQNFLTIKNLFEEKNRCLTAIERPQKKPVIVTGSGPSLDDSSKYLKDWDGSVISGATTASVFPKNEAEPDFITAFDSHRSIVNYFNKFTWNKASLITHPHSSPDLLEYWKRDIYFFRRIIPNIPLFELHLPLLYPQISVGIIFTSSVTNNIISLTQFLGYDAIFLFGADLSYTDKGRCSYFEPNEDGTFKEDVLLTEDFIGNKKTELFYYENSDIITSEVFCGFKHQLYDLWKHTNIPIFNCSKGSILTEMPYVDPEEVIEKQGKGFEKLYEGFDKNKAIDSYTNKFRRRTVKGKKVFK